ncbi:MAG: hypothetical protein RL688_289, partial [Actinomycetota bacterium]
MTSPVERISGPSAVSTSGNRLNGNTASLTRLGVGLSSAEIKTLGLEGTVKQLAETFGGAATVQANTFEGQIQRLRVGFDEAKESVGAALLPTLQKLLDYFINTVIPKFIEVLEKKGFNVPRGIFSNRPPGPTTPAAPVPVATPSVSGAQAANTSV